jgi:hypothetical protein
LFTKEIIWYRMELMDNGYNIFNRWNVIIG